MYVPLRTLSAAVRLVDRLADPDQPEDFALSLLEGLSRLVPCDVLTYNELSPRPQLLRYRDWPPGAMDSGAMARFDRHAHEHPSIRYYQRTGDGGPVMIRDFLSTTEFHRLGLYTEFFRLIPVEEQVALRLADGGPGVIGVAFNRARGEFDEVDRAVLALLREPLVSARQRADMRTAALAGTATIDGAEPLTERETEVIRLVAQGRTNEAISRALGVSPRTVAKHLEHIYRKLHATNRAAAAVAARPVR
jgi:DNA-binding CsgD family transcriptional regulator